jgi:hypothetical protein
MLVARLCPATASRTLAAVTLMHEQVGLRIAVMQARARNSNDGSIFRVPAQQGITIQLASVDLSGMSVSGVPRKKKFLERNGNSQGMIN